jgi:dTDP-4-dehydrorhamnose reductase
MPWLAVRLPMLVAEDGDRRCMVTGWVDAFVSDGEIRCATDQFFTLAATSDAAAAIGDLLRRSAQGLYHLGGPERVSRRELLDAVAREYARVAPVRARIVECRLAELPFVEARPAGTSMASTRVKPLSRAKFRGASAVAEAAVQTCLRNRR